MICVCPICNKEFEQHTNQQRRFCSAKCRNKNHVRKNSPLSQPAFCLYCNAPLNRRTSKQIFCTPKCANTFYRKHGNDTRAPILPLPPLPKRLSPAAQKLLGIFYRVYPKPVSMDVVLEASLYSALTRLVIDEILVVTTARDDSTPRYKLSIQRLAEWDNQ